jgi:hypothetical protein
MTGVCDVEGGGVVVVVVAGGVTTVAAVVVKVWSGDVAELPAASLETTL